jgi:ATP-dependent helicase HepA
VTGWLRKLVLVRDDHRLFGKVIADRDDFVDVEFFRSVADREVRQLAKRSVAHAALPRQTRVFVPLSASVWRVGRVIDKYKTEIGIFSYTLKFPNDEVSEMAEDDCFVRCLDRYADPSKILAAGCIETQFFADRRRSALRRLRDLRAAAQGLTAVLSASVELVPHQVATVRRVLTDPHMRYLLADEVGLGKTIEAGLIMRQLLLDEPTLSIEVYVPTILTSQWKSELQQKCHLDDEDIIVRSHDELKNADPAKPPNLLVVDEVHRLIVSDSQDGSESYHQLRQLALRVPRLLLLSATPALGDEARLLALLNLLDPLSYPLDDLASFKRCVDERQQIGRLLLAMRPGAASFVLRQQAIRATEMFPDDRVVRTEANRVLLSGEDRVECDAATSALHDHVANTYRIHQRLIRARRIDVEKWTMRPRGPEWPMLSHVRLFYSETPDAEVLLNGLEAWRDNATRVSRRDNTLALKLAERWLGILDAAWQGGRFLSDMIQKLAPVFPGESDSLEEIARLGETRAAQDDRYIVAGRVLSDWLRQLGTDVSGRPKKLVCFSSAAEDALRLAQHLKRTIGSGRVTTLAGLSTDSETVVAEFAASMTARVLVCDSASEEGLNLQFVHGILHMNLPFAAARVEQRIGRLDRFGRTLDRVEHRIFLPDEGDLSPWRSWFALLANGFKVFNRSISDVQFQIANIEPGIALQLLREGVYAVDALTADVVSKLADERQKLDEQYALDNLSQFIDDGEGLIGAIEKVEEDESALAVDVEPWITQVLGLRVEPVGAPSAQSLQVTWGSDVLLPEIPWRGALERAFHQRWTWRRRQSIRRTGPAACLIRPGANLVEGLERVALWDDRGIAYATWRVEPKWPEMWRGFRFVWIIEPAVATSAAVYARPRGSELVRRADAFLPTLTAEQLVDYSGSLVSDPEILGILGRPYRQDRDSQGRVDLNLGSRPEALREAVDWGQFVAQIEEITAQRQATLLETPEISTKVAHALRACERDISNARRRLQVRRELAAAFPGMVEMPPLEEEIDLSALGKSIEFPRIRLDEIGFFVIAPMPPEI